MKITKFVLCFIGAALLSVATLPAAAISFDLNCVLSSTACTALPPGESLGMVQIADIAGGVEVTVVTTDGGKYVNLFLNLDVTPSSMILPAIYSSNGYTLTPYEGLFDVGSGVSPSKGFDGDSGQTFQILGTGFDATSFNAFDSLGLVNVAVHLQELDCTASGCVPGNGSIKVGGVLSGPPSDDPIPEPATMAIVGGGLIGVYFLRRKTS